MDVFPGMSVDTIKIAIWVTTFVVAAGVLAFYIRKAETKRRYAWAIAKAILGASLTAAFLCVVAMGYIVSHPTDLRWSEGRKSLITFDDIGQNTFFQDFAAPLNDVKNTAVDAANKAIAIENALATLPEFLTMALWAAGIALVVGAPMAIITSVQKKRLYSQFRATKAYVVKHNAVLQEMQRRNGVDEKDVLPDMK